MMKRSTRLGLLLILTAAGAVVVSSVRGRNHPPPPIDEVGEVADREIGGGEAPSLAPEKVRARRPIEPPSVRRRVQEAADRAAAMTPAEQLPTYLDELLARARTRGEVTALEAEVGRDLIKRYGADVHTEMRFVAKLNELARELRHETPGSVPSKEQALASLDATAGQLAAEQDPAKRGELVRQYMDQAATLAPEEQARLMSQLNKLVAPPPAGPPTASDLDVQWAAVLAASGESRQSAIDAFVDAVHQLPPDLRIGQMRRLNGLAPP